MDDKRVESTDDERIEVSEEDFEIVSGGYATPDPAKSDIGIGIDPNGVR